MRQSGLIFTDMAMTKTPNYRLKLTARLPKYVSARSLT